MLSLCEEAGLAKVGLIAIDGTKLHANASHHANLDYEQLAREILKEAAEVDAAEDELFGDARGDELPSEFQSTGELRKRLREAKQRLDAKRAAEPKPVPRSRPERLLEAKKRLEQELELERRVRLITRPGGRVGSAPTGAGSEAGSRSLSRCPSSRGGGSRRPILIRAT